MKVNKKILVAKYCVWICFFIFFYSFLYSDMMITVRHGMNFWTCLFESNIRNFYQFNFDAVINNLCYMEIKFAAGYDFLIYLVFAIWNFPLWILETYFSVDVFNSFFCLIWMKTLLIIPIISTIHSMKSICWKLEVPESIIDYVDIIFLTSSIFISSVVIISQYDIICLAFIMWGIYYLLCYDWKKFIFMFSLAIPMKYFALIIFLPILLFLQKNICKILKSMLIAFVPMIVFRVLVPFYVTSNISVAQSTIMNNKYSVAIGETPLIVILLTLLCIFCYCIVPSKEEQLLKKQIIYICFLAFAIYLFGAYTYSYWSIYLVPFATILILQNKKHFRINLLLDTAFSIGLVGAQIITFAWCYQSNIAGNLFVSILAGRHGEPIRAYSVIDLFRDLVVENAPQIIEWMKAGGIGVFAACIIVFAIINLPRNSDKEDIYLVTETIETSVLLLRTGVATLVCLIPVVAYIASVVMP